MIRHVDCQLYFNVTWNRYKAVIYLNGEKVQEMFDFSLHELKERLWKKIDELDPRVTRRSLKLCSGPLNRLHGIVRLRLFRYKQLKRKTLFLLAQNRSLDQKVCTRDPVYRIPCFENIIIGRTATLCVGGARSKPCVIRSFNSSHL